ASAHIPEADGKIPLAVQPEPYFLALCTGNFGRNAASLQITEQDIAVQGTPYHFLKAGSLFPLFCPDTFIPFFLSGIFRYCASIYSGDKPCLCHEAVTS